jgi:hypothetical protein
VGRLNGVSSPVVAPRPFSLVGVSWEGPHTAAIDLRTRLSGGRGWSRWVPASTQGHEPDRALGASERRYGEPVWCGAAMAVQLRSAAPVAGVRVHFVPAERAAVRAGAGLVLAQPVLDAGPGQPPIIARSAWGGRTARPAVAPHYGTIKLAFVHHPQGTNGYGPGQVPGILRGIFDYHRFVRGFWDIAYNFAVDAFGRVWEARAGGIDKPVIGAHAGGYNAESTGVVVLGDFMNVSPSVAALGALERFLAWKLSLHGLPSRGRVTVVVSPGGGFYSRFGAGARVSLPRVAGHRDGDSTDCPGNVLYGELPSVRSRVAALAGVPVRVTLSGAPAQAVAPAALSLSGFVRSLAGAPLAGAPVELQAVVPGGALTIATATTGADGSWSAQVTLTGNALLRALHQAAPAAVSPLASAAVAPAVTLNVSSGPPVVVSGTVAPAKRAVVIEVRRRGRVVRRKRVAVSGGAFAAVVWVARPGDVVRAVTPADVLNAAGVSPALAVSS